MLNIVSFEHRNLLSYFILPISFLFLFIALWPYVHNYKLV